MAFGKKSSGSEAVRDKPPRPKDIPNRGRYTLANVPEGYELVAPEGGWGWVVSIGCLIITTMISVPTLAFGVMLKDMISVMQISNATASWTVAIALAVSQAVAPIATIAIHVFSSRVTAFTGGILIALGMFLSAFATNIVILSLTFGVITGIGVGISRVPCLVIGSQYFPKRYGIVAGIIFSGFSIGRLAFTPVVQVAKENYGYQGTFILISGICLNVCVGAAVFQPVSRHMVLHPIAPKPNPNKEAEAKEAEAMNGKSIETFNAQMDQKTQRTQSINISSSPQKFGSKNSIEMKEMSRGLLSGSKQHLDVVRSRASTVAGMGSGRMDYDLQGSPDLARVARSGEVYASIDSLDRIRESAPSKKQLPVVKTIPAPPPPQSKLAFYKKQLKSSLDFSLLNEAIFYLILISSVLTYLTILYSNVFLVPLGMDKGFSAMDASLVITAKSIAEIAGRMGFPVVQKVFKINPVLFFTLNCLSVALLLMVQALVTSFAGFMALGVLCGIVTGGTVVLNMQVTLISVGLKKFPSTIGLCSFIQSIFALFAGPLIGYVKDVTGSFVACYMMIVGLQVISTLLWLGRFIYMWRENRKKATAASQNA